MKFRFSLPKLGSKKVTIDWGSSSLKIISASKLKQTYLITDFVYQKTEEELPKILSKIWQERNFPLFNIILCLDGASTLLRVVDFPKMDKKTIKESLGYELSRYIPFSESEVYFDFSILNIESSPENLKLLIASAKKDFVDEKLAILKEAGIFPSKITLSPVSLVNAFLKLFPHQDVPVGILDLGFSYSMITIVYKDNIYLSREVRRGAKDILLRLSNILGAEINNFRDLADKQADINPQLVSEISSDLIEEVRLSLDYLETKENLKVQRIYSTGGLTSFKGLEDILAQNLGIEVLPFNLLNFFSCTSSIKKNLEELEGNFSVAISSLL